MSARCDVWLLDAAASRGARAAAAALLSPDERARAAAFRFERDRTLYELAHGLVRAVLAEATGCRADELVLTAGPRGRPHATAPARATTWSFNLSHTHGLVGVALSRDARVGFDAEHTGRVVDPLQVGETVFSAAELGALRALRPDQQRERFFQLWVLKEAYIKARGLGVHLDLKSFAFALDDEALGFAPAPDDDARWSFHRATRGRGHAWAVAADADDLVVHVHEGEPVLERA